jgi:branched-chain amino acid transport system substrate-binding protein
MRILTCLVTLTALVTGQLQIAVADSAPLKIGVILPLTGEVAQFGSILRGGIESSVHPGVEFVYEDDACQSGKAMSAYNKLHDLDGIRFFLGPCCGGAMSAVAPRLAHDAQLSFATCPVSEDAFTISKGRILTPQYSIQEESSFNARRVYELGYRKVVIILQDTEFGHLNEAVFKKNFPGQVVDTISYVGFDITQLRPALLRLKKLDFDAVYFPHMEPLLLGALKELRDKGITGKAAFSIFSAQVPEILTANGTAAEGLRYSYPDIPLADSAVSYFPKIAAEMLSEAMKACSADYACVNARLHERFEFSEMGTLKRKIVLRMVKNGNFALEQ